MIKTKRLLPLLIVIFISVIIIIYFLLNSSEKPLKDLKVNNIISINITQPTYSDSEEDKKTKLLTDKEEIQKIVDILKTIVTYEASNEPYFISKMIFTLNMQSEKSIEVVLSNGGSDITSFIKIDGQEYRTKYKPCDELMMLALKIINK